MRQISIQQFNDRYKVQQKLGSGSYGVVYKLYDFKEKKHVALKKITLRRHEKLQHFLEQIQIQMRLAHPLVVQIFEYYIIESKHKGLVMCPQIGIVMQLGAKSVLQLISMKNMYFSIDQIIKFAYQFTKLFSMFQEVEVVHRDIKPDNFIQFKQEPMEDCSKLNCKLADFGLCTIARQNLPVGGSFYYLSPILKRKRANKFLKLCSNPFKDDVFSFGLTLYELITKKIGQKKSLDRISDEIYKETRNQDLSDIVSMMLQIDERSRPDFLELFQIFQARFPTMQPKQEPIFLEGDISNNSSRTSKMSLDFKDQISKDFENRCSACLEADNSTTFKLQSNQKGFKYNQGFEYEECQMKSIAANQQSSQKQRIQQIEFLDMCNKEKNQKTIKQETLKQIYHKSLVFQLNPKIDIMTLQSIKQFVIFGCFNGQIYVLNIEDKKIHKVVEAVPTHTKYVSMMSKDKKGNVWFVTGDGKLVVWNKIMLLKTLQDQNKYEVKVKERKGLTGKIIEKREELVHFPEDIGKAIMIPFFHQGGISTLYCKNESNFAVGFYDGYIYGLWEGEQFHFHGHIAPVTSLKVRQDNLYSGGLDGSIKIFSLSNLSLNPKFIQTKHQIINFEVQGSDSKPFYTIVTTEGKRLVYEEKNPGEGYVQNQLSFIIVKNKDTMCSLDSDGYCYSIAIDGAVYRDNAMISNFSDNGWNCMIKNGEKGLVAAGFGGKLKIISWDE